MKNSRSLLIKESSVSDQVFKHYEIFVGITKSKRYFVFCDGNKVYLI